MTTAARHPADRVYVDASDRKLRQLTANGDAHAIAELVTRTLTVDGGLLATTGILHRLPEAVRVRVLDLFVGKRVEVDTGSRYAAATDAAEPHELTEGTVTDVAIGALSSAVLIVKLDPALNRRNRAIATATIRRVRQLP